MATVNPYLNFNDTTEEAFNFYRSVFGGEFAMVMRFKDVPKEHQGAASEADKIMHIALPIGQGTMIMGSDTPEAWGKTTMGTNFSISISAVSKEEADKFYNGLSAAGKATMPMSDTFWGSYFGMLTDKFGINWMVGYDDNPTP